MLLNSLIGQDRSSIGSPRLSHGLSGLSVPRSGALTPMTQAAVSEKSEGAECDMHMEIASQTLRRSYSKSKSSSGDDSPPSKNSPEPLPDHIIIFRKKLLLIREAIDDLSHPLQILLGSFKTCLLKDYDLATIISMTNHFISLFSKSLMDYYKMRGLKQSQQDLVQEMCKSIVLSEQMVAHLLAKEVNVECSELVHEFSDATLALKQWTL